MFALLVANKAISQYHGTPFEEPLKTAFRRLTGQLDQTVKFSLGSLDGVLSFHPFAPEDADLRAFETITRALTERRELAFSYRNHGAQTPQKRRVQPYHLACIQNVWYLIGFDVQRQAMRTFALTRLQRAALQANGSRCRRSLMRMNIWQGASACSRAATITRWWWILTSGRRTKCAGGAGIVRRN